MASCQTQRFAAANRSCVRPVLSRPVVVIRWRTAVRGSGVNFWRAGRRIRTDDLLITNQLLYQLSYAGIYEGNQHLRDRLKRPLYPLIVPLLITTGWAQQTS